MWANFYERVGSQDLDNVVILELRTGTQQKSGNGEVLAGTTCDGIDEAWEFAEQWARNNWVCLDDTEKKVIGILASYHAKGRAKVDPSLIGDCLSGADEQAQGILTNLAERGFVEYVGRRIGDAWLTEKGEQAARELGLWPDCS